MMMTSQDAQVEIVVNPNLKKAVMSPGPVPFLSRGQILQATEACFTEAGYDGTTIRAIAGRLDCSVGSIYRYFQDKRELLLACGERLMKPAVEAAMRPDAACGEAVRTYVQAAQTNMQLYKLMFWLMCGRGLPTVIHKTIALWGDLLRDPPSSETLWTRVHGMLTLGYEQGVIVELVSANMPTTSRPAVYPITSPMEDMTLL